MFDDWSLIESSFAWQYNIRLERENDMTWTEFFNLMTGLLSDSPLGQIINIRAEKQKETLKGFNKDQHAIRNEWRRNIDKQRISSMPESEKKKAVVEIQDIFKQMFSENK